MTKTDTRTFGEAALQGWREKIAVKTAPAVSEHTPFDRSQVRRGIGVVFFVLAAAYVVRTILRSRNT